MSTTDEAPAAGARTERRFGGLAKVAGPVVAALLVGGGAVFAVEHHSSPSASAGSAPAAFGTGGPGSGGPGGVAGEQHVRGTVAAKSASSVTVRSSNGATATYVVNVTTQIVRNGKTATLADVKVGDPVFVHVYPSSSGRLLVERLFAGSSASGGGEGGFGPPPSDT
ncbi:MAG TPA: hypothetical protein VFA19_06660 [Gaiellaceae bacterium]|nr:hypothetical protein [Gaiellaceae bacterium]